MLLLNQSGREICVGMCGERRISIFRIERERDGWEQGGENVQTVHLPQAV